MFSRMRSFAVAAGVAIVLTGPTSRLLATVTFPDLQLTFDLALDNGDTNSDGERDLSDGLFTLAHLFLGGPEPAPLALCGGEAAVDNGDLNGDAVIDVSDVVYGLSWLFAGGPDPVDACAADGSGAHRRHRPRVVPPRIFRRVYSVLAGTWWQWLLSIPASVNPFLDETGASCDINQPRRFLYYLAGAGAADPPVTRHCTISRGTFVFFPIINTECSNLEPIGGCPPDDPECDDSFFCDDRRSCLDCNDKFYDPENDVLSVTVDGVEIRRLTRFRVQSGVFPIGPLPDDNFLGVPEGTTGISLADGYYVLLAPLGVGEHTIEVRGCLEGFGGCEGFEILVVYNLTVVDD